MNQIKFFKKWSKLDKSVYTTMRIHTQEKYDYYSSREGQQFLEVVKGEVTRRVRLLYVSRDTIRGLNDHLIRFDADCDRDGFMRLMRRFYGTKDEWHEANTIVIILLFEVIEDDIQTKL